MGNAEREPITGVWRQSPQRGTGADPWSGVNGQGPPKAERLFALSHGSPESANLS